MAVLTMNFRGPKLGKASTVNIITPDATASSGPWPVLYLLHGYSDNHSAWLENTSIARYALERKMMIVMPDGMRTWYADTNEEDTMEQFITGDLIECIDGTFNTVKSAGSRAIAGLSMGGYGATMLALRHPELYCCASAHSGAFFYAHETIKDMPKKVSKDSARLSKKYDVFKLTSKLPADKRFKLRLDCGKSDWIIKWNRDLHKHLNSLGWKHTYKEYPGDHNWNYWDAHICETLDFAMKSFKISE